MKLVVISPEGEDSREIAVMGELFAAGLERYHVRKRGWSEEKLRAWLRTLPEDWRSRLVLHGHHDLVSELGLGGRHWRDAAGEGRGMPVLPLAETARPSGLPYSGVTSRSCHDLPTLRAALGRYDSVFFGPVFSSISKPGHEPRADLSFDEISKLLAARSPSQRRTAVLALGGVTAEKIPQLHAIGFDGAAVLGAVWQSVDPLADFHQLQNAIFPMPLNSVQRHPVMCLTQDNLPLTHVEQAARLCAAGAKWIQLRMKNADAESWLAAATEVANICRAQGALCIVNDNIEVALASGADGVHLGRLDADWCEARRRLGPERILGGTVNNSADAQHARAAGGLDYVGVGPLRFTTNKKNLSPMLGFDGVRALIVQLGELPAWVIGGVAPEDLPALHAAGAAGAAVSGALFRDDRVEENVRAFLAAWDAQPISMS